MSNLPASQSDSIDYIRYTLPAIVGVMGALPNLSEFQNDSRSPIVDHAFFGYTQQRKLPCGVIIMWNPEQEQLGVCVQASGNAVRNIEAEITSAWALIRWAEQNGARLKRIDYAIDLVGSEAIPPPIIAEAVQNGEIAFRGRAWQWVETNPKGASQRAVAGSTLYLGSRASDRFVRYYDKAAQQKLMGVSWSRLELELKDRRAQQYAAQCENGDWMGYGRGQMFDYLYSDDSGSAAAIWLSQIRQSAPHKAPEALSRLDSKPDSFVDKIVLPFLRGHGSELADKNLVAIRTLVNGELFARDWHERQFDSDWGVDTHPEAL